MHIGLKVASEAPPNLRLADIGSSQRCDMCKYYTKNTCTMYDVPVEGHQVCDDFAPISSNPAAIPKAVLDLAKPVGPVEPVEPMKPIKPGEQLPLSKESADRLNFKLGFLARCRDEGLTNEQIEARVSEALDGHKKQANPLLYGALGAAGIGSGILSGGAAALPLIAGGLALPMGVAGAWLGRQRHEKNKQDMIRFNDENKVDVGDVQNLELINEYSRMSEAIKQHMQQRELAAKTPAPRSWLNR